MHFIFNLDFIKKNTLQSIAWVKLNILIQKIESTTQSAALDSILKKKIKFFLRWK
jgi:hypothetical protein